MGMEEVRIPVGEGVVTASVHGAGPTVVILGHGAGSDRRHPRLLDLAEVLSASGRQTVLYNFPYTDRGGRAPDPAPVLEGTTRAVGEYARGVLGAARLVHGGRSMGGRIASQAVAAGAPADGLVFLAYPLHPPGRPEVRRERHLPGVTAPMLFVQGTRDAFARWDLLEALLARLGDRASLHRIEDGDHSFAVRKRSGRRPEDVRAEVQDAVLSWLKARGL
jgi:predicted alpha/beta-hydrolase family hydrolase